eukprot:594231-Pyramimonas_sp.AAC.1
MMVHGARRTCRLSRSNERSLPLSSTLAHPIEWGTVKMMSRAAGMMVPVVTFLWMAYQLCLFVGFARASAEHLLTFAIQRAPAILPRWPLRMVFGHLLPGATQWAGFFASVQGQARISHDLVSGMTKSGPTTGESWAWPAAVSQPCRIITHMSDHNRDAGNAHEGLANPREA